MSMQPKSDLLAALRRDLQALDEVGVEHQTPSSCELKGLLLDRIEMIEAAMRRTAEIASAAAADTIADAPPTEFCHAPHFFPATA
jgi:hypothetical protein